MRIRKGYFFRKIAKNKIIILNLSLILLIFCAVLSRISRENKSGDTIAYMPLYDVDTSESVYSITVDLSGKENEDDVRLLAQVLKGMKVEATFFVTTDWIKSNEKLIEIIKNDGHIFALMLDNDFTNQSRRDGMKYLANENDLFFSKCGYYPLFIRIKTDKTGKIPELISAFGQKYVSASHYYNASLDNIRAGAIVSITEIDSDTPYNIAEYIVSCSEKGYKSLPLENLVEKDLKQNTINSES